MPLPAAFPEIYNYGVVDILKRYRLGMRDELLADMSSLRTDSSAIVEHAGSYANAARRLHDLRQDGSWGDDELTSSLLDEHTLALSLAVEAHGRLQSLIDQVGTGVGDMARTYADADERSRAAITRLPETGERAPWM
jgi:uncharacterized protein YukE